jgi:hypothetical protein
MTPTNTTGPLAEHPLRAPVLWGAAWALIQAAAPLGFWWLDRARRRSGSTARRRCAGVQVRSRFWNLRGSASGLSQG